MPNSDVDVVVIGGGAAGVAAAKRLHRSVSPLPPGRGASAARRPGVDRHDETALRSISAAAGCIPPTAILGSASRMPKA